ncbi:ROK family protein [Mycolicibacterium thermoresistibile]
MPTRARRALVARQRIVAPSLRVADAAAASVFEAVRTRGPIARDAIAKASGLSIATVNRQVTALFEAGLLRERADLAVSGAVGRPRVPVEVNHEPYLTLAIHIGARTTSIAATDLFGRTLDVVETPTPRGAQPAALAALAESARRYLSRWHRRRPLWVGVAAGGVFDVTTGHLDHPLLGWTDAPVGPVIAEALRLPVSVAPHLDAMAAAELLLGRPRRRGPTSLYVYARESVGFALSIGGRVHSPASGPGTIAALPVNSELLGGTGQLESTVSDQAVVTAARRLRIIAADGPTATITAVLRAAERGDAAAAELLEERARVLGESLALLRDMLNPDELVVGGQAFTDYAAGMTTLTAAFTVRSVLPPLPIRSTAFGDRVQEAGAGVVSLGSLYSDPVGAMRRALDAPGISGRALSVQQATG